LIASPDNEVATPAFFASSSLGIENKVDCCFVVSCLVVDDDGEQHQ